MVIDREIVIKLRALERMTQEQFASKIGVHHSMISGIERNRKDVSRGLAIRIVAAFGLTPERIREIRELPA
ncbi:helix-turn-helix transcriptional regulator [Brevibacillus composti]|uniref:Helix-turn-helix transcriptional regulator n=2 Tax=Brevibacillus composti TaxID=2796470 RepID=A0A7T5EIC0_9BACL|nr:helix-turn-helix transcriptional regulator [Brevibacillus borstelensis]MED1874155.1 helix-turn-helix transcriptional regulator [Brevibacillus borstelensis]QQE73159.1 helix-turn-helix transcriptional regulator [Brevibacillus composti]QUO40237.1 helix-turn-helix transcriptional regulator [Brevibacillus composti]